MTRTLLDDWMHGRAGNTPMTPSPGQPRWRMRHPGDLGGPEQPTRVTDVTPGKRYEFTLTGVVPAPDGTSHACQDASMTVHDDHGHTHFLDPASPSLRARQLGPAFYPPQPGDVWRDSAGLLWFAALEPGSGQDEMVLNSSSRRGQSAAAARDMELVFRPGIPVIISSSNPG